MLSVLSASGEQGLPPSWPQLSRALRGRAKRTPIKLSNPALRHRSPSLRPPPLPALAARGSQHASHPRPPGDSALPRCRVAARGRRSAASARRATGGTGALGRRRPARRGSAAQSAAPTRSRSRLAAQRSQRRRPCTVSLIAVAWSRMERDADLPIADDTPMRGGGSGAPT